MQIETKIKRKIYIFLAIILGMLLGVTAYALTEKAHINNLLSQSSVADSIGGNGFLLPPSVSAIFLFAGAIFGYILGVRWWQIVYVEKRHWRMRRK